MATNETNSRSGLNGDDLLQRFLRSAAGFRFRHGCEFTMLLQLDQAQLLVCVWDGQIIQLRPPQLPLQTWTFAIRGSRSGWERFWESPPDPGWHDLFALAKRGEFVLEGNLQPLMANLQSVKDLLALARGDGHGR